MLWRDLALITDEAQVRGGHASSGCGSKERRAARRLARLPHRASRRCPLKSRPQRGVGETHACRSTARRAFCLSARVVPRRCLPRFVAQGRGPQALGMEIV
eukprot:CAMPEP_0176214538 /NCGR_PEP_ID=MMETSP0121_2-20121125/16223_1 /TAXON_ID=160619 /ORGANISM="Kryptoperidinium foliaceum, Strain CCMP 1326" /LENGTH=100 /DNA_ID=CAMNT_0017553629 /DNA_START=117 /DNA_END=416 /DNA_ORIENTATION=-